MGKRLYMKNSKGVAMVSIMIAIAFLSVIATAMLYISTNNYAMKVANANGKKNFYVADGSLTKTMSSVRNVVMKDNYSADPKNKIDDFLAVGLSGDPIKTLDANGVGTATYDISSIVSKAYPGASGSTVDVYDDEDPTKKVATLDFSQSGNHVSITKPSANVTRYTFEDIKVVSTSADNNIQNSVKTDMNFDVLESVSSSSSAGGVGNMSLLLDSSLNTNSQSFKGMTLEGNVFIADYGSKTTWDTAVGGDGKEYIAPGTAALKMGTETKIIFKGSNNVVYGDMELGNGACVVVYGNLTVYGDIRITGTGTLTIADGGNLYQLDTPLPGRTTASTISAGAKNTYPNNLTSTKITKDKFIKFAQTISITHVDGSTLYEDGEYGLINKVFVKKAELGDNRLLDSPYCIEMKSAPSTLTAETSDGYGYHTASGFTPFKSSPESFGFLIWGRNKDCTSLNGNFQHRLVIFLKSSGGYLKFQQSNPYTTVISREPIYGHQAHGVTLSKIGTDEFNYMTAAKGDAESAVYNDDSKNPFNKIEIRLKDGQGAGAQSVGGEKNLPAMAFGSFFASDCNKIVDDMFAASLDGESGGSKSYTSAISFGNYARDEY